MGNRRRVCGDGIVCGVAWAGIALSRIKHGEKYYQRIFEDKLKESGLTYQKELPRTLRLKGGKIFGRYFVDFLVEDKVVVELKVANDFYPSHINQLLGYLLEYDFKVGILAAMTPEGVKIKRLIN